MVETQDWDQTYHLRRSAEVLAKFCKSLRSPGNLLKLMHAESLDLAWKSLIYNLPRGVLSFAVRASIDFLPNQSRLF